MAVRDLMARPNRSPWRALLGDEPQRWLVIALPLLLLAANGSWLWDSPRYYDTNVYIGFFKHYLEFKLPYIANYKSSRLPFVLPGVLLYRLLPAAAAHHLLHLAFLTAEALAMYSMVRRRFGGRAAYVTTAALVTSTFGHILSSYHDQAATAYFVLALLALEWPARAPWPARFAAAGALYALGLTTDTVLVLLAPFLVIHALDALPRPFHVRRVVVGAAVALAGAAAGLGLFGLLNVILGGPFLFFMEQVRYSANITKTQPLSRFSLLAIPRSIGDLPLLAVPAVIGVASLGVLARNVWTGRWGRTAIEAGGYVLSLAIAAAAQKRGLAILDNHVLFQVFSGPMFLALGALLGHFGSRGDGWVGWRFALLVAALFVAPLALAGGLISRFLSWVGPIWPAATQGVPFVFILGVIAAGIAWRMRARNPAPALAIAAALGLANPLCTEITQPAYLYQLGAECPFRAEAFQAVLEADAVISEFDPLNEANWSSAGGSFEEPLFDGRDYCHRLPVETAARAAWLTHYFFTSDELIFGMGARPLKKFTMLATSLPQLAAMEKDLRAGIPPGRVVQQKVLRSFPHSTFTLVVGGYEILPSS